MRQTCRIMARSHVSAIVVESSDFFDLMMRHPETRESFLAAAALNTDFLKAPSDPEELEDISQARNNPVSFIILPNTPWIQAWELFSVIFTCYPPFVVMFYRIMTDAQLGWISLTVLYTMDVVFIVKIVLVFFTAFEDHKGDYIMVKSQIAER